MTCSTFAIWNICNLSTTWGTWNMPTMWKPWEACHLYGTSEPSETSESEFVWDHAALTLGPGWGSSGGLCDVNSAWQGGGGHPTNNPSEALCLMSVGCIFISKKNITNFKADLNSMWGDLTKRSARNHHRVTLYCFVDGPVPSLISKLCVLLVHWPANSIIAQFGKGHFINSVRREFNEKTDIPYKIDSYETLVRFDNNTITVADI